MTMSVRIRDSAATLEASLGQADRQRLDQYMSSIRDVERSISALTPEFGRRAGK